MSIEKVASIDLENRNASPSTYTPLESGLADDFAIMRVVNDDTISTRENDAQVIREYVPLYPL